MALHDVIVPLYGLSDDKSELIVDEFAGRIQLNIRKDGIELGVECYFEDLERAWNAVKK